MKKWLMVLCFSPLCGYSQLGGVNMHCGYDFTSYLVVHPHESGNEKTISGLKISVCNSEGVDVININNALSWKNANKPLIFFRNYRIDADNKKLPEGTTSGKWFYYFAQDHYLLSISNTFKADDFFVKIEDVDGEENGGTYKTQIIPLAAYNMYVLCSAEERDKVVQFGRKMNKPIQVVMEKE